MVQQRPGQGLSGLWKGAGRQLGRRSNREAGLPGSVTQTTARGIRNPPEASAAGWCGETTPSDTGGCRDDESARGIRRRLVKFQPNQNGLGQRSTNCLPRDQPTSDELMPAKIDLTGAQFGRLVVLTEAPAKRKPSGARVRRWLCRCSCGTELEVRGESLMSGNTSSCGCLKAEIARRPNLASTRHGMVGTPTYSSWASMLSRCRHAHKPENRWHGGSGVKVCPQWDPKHGGSFENFFAAAGVRPEGTTLDRFPDEKGHYEPGNIRWATTEQQASNKRSNVWVEYQGQRLTLAQAARASGIHCDTLGLRHRKGERGARLFRPTAHTGRRAWKSQGTEPSCAGSSLAA